MVHAGDTSETPPRVTGRPEGQPQPGRRHGPVATGRVEERRTTVAGHEDVQFATGLRRVLSKPFASRGPRRVGCAAWRSPRSTPRMPTPAMHGSGSSRTQIGRAHV